MKRYGCVGKTLKHSFSKEIHKKLADYRYDLIELSEEEVAPFFRNKEFAAVNVTTPYKQTVMQYLDVTSDVARRIGAVNTVVNKNGKLYGYNTDYHGMKALLARIGLDLKGKKVLILGTGGTSKTANAVAEDLGASQILKVSRSKAPGVITYDEAISAHRDAEVLINTTPLGMYPDCDGCPIGLAPFDRLEGVIDAVYNPLCTHFVLEAKARGLKAEGGLYMLVMQAVVAVERFLDQTLDRGLVETVFESVLLTKENVVLIGMPACGKSTVGRLLNLEGFAFVDTDVEVEKRCGCSIKELIETRGEVYFRALETDVIREISAQNGLVISTGGGAILSEENVRHLKQNGKLFFLDVPLSRLCATQDRPLSDTPEKLRKVYEERIGLYRSAADVVVPDMKTPEEFADFILKNRK